MLSCLLGSACSAQQQPYLQFMGRQRLVLAGAAAGVDGEACKEGVEDVSDAGDSEDTELAMADGSIDSGAGPKERHECIVCGITTTSAAHLEVGAFPLWKMTCST